MKNKKLTIVLIIVFILGLILGSYAIYKSTYTGKNENKIITDSTSLEFLESNTNVINIPNAIPMSDEEGKTQSDAFDFVVTSKTSKNQNISYSIVLEKLQTEDGNVQQLSDDEIKVYLTDFDGNELLLKNVSDISKDYVLYTKTNNHNSTNIETKDKYKLRVWIDEKNTNIDFNKENDITYAFKLGVKTNVNETDTEETYVVNYNSNGGTGTMNSTTFKQGETKKLSKNTFTKNGYTFKGWSINNSKDVVYTDEEQVSNLTNVYNGVVNLYAVWVKEGVTYQVKYNPNGGTGTMTNSSFTTGVKSKLTKNVFTKTGNIFKGWSTKLNGNVKYNDEEEVIDLTEDNNTIVDLYAVWEKEEYEVNVVVQNGVINGDSTKRVKYNEDGIFNIISDIENALGVVTCTNNQKGTFKDNQVTIKNITNNTTCTVKVTSEVTSLYEDGTFIINEQNTNRNSNIEKHGKVANEYNAMDSDNSYAFSSYNSSLWYSERRNVKGVEIGKTIQPTSTAYWFYQFDNVEKGYFSNLDTSRVTDMRYMFVGLGESNTVATVNLDLSSWDTSNVTNMNYMFWGIGYDGKTINLDLSNWNTAKVTDMSYMFFRAGYHAETLNLVGLDSWNTAKVTDMSYMFAEDAGEFSDTKTWSIGDLSNWNTSSVTNMRSMFFGTGEKATTWSIGDLSNWDTSNVTDMSSMFSNAGSSATTWSIGDISNWDTSNVINTKRMFSSAGQNATTFNLDLSNWNTSNVTGMESMFDSAGQNATTFNLNLSNWDTSKVTNMNSIFNGAGKNAKTWSIGDLSNWNTSSVTNMSYMFYQTGQNATTFNLNLSNWDTSKVTDMSSMFSNAGSSATTFNLVGLEKWNTSNVTDMRYMFEVAGRNATTFNLDLSNWDTSKVKYMNTMFSNAGSSATTWSIGNISNWDTSNVTSMSSMFYYAGSSATTWNIGDLSNWNTSSVTNMSFMFNHAGEKATTWSIGDLSNWNTSKVTGMRGMFLGAGQNATNFNLNLSNWNTSKVTNMKEMFSSAGLSATTWTVKIPSTTGNLTNTTSKWYGSSSSVYAEPCSGKSFTLS